MQIHKFFKLRPRSQVNLHKASNAGAAGFFAFFRLLSVQPRRRGHNPSAGAAGRLSPPVKVHKRRANFLKIHKTKPSPAFLRDDIGECKSMRANGFIAFSIYLHFGEIISQSDEITLAKALATWYSILVYQRATAKTASFEK